MEKNPYSIIKHRHVTEKSAVLAQLQHSESNSCLRKCKTPKYVFIVDLKANKQEIKWAIETIYVSKKVKVSAVNTIIIKPKVKRVRGHLGKTSAFKKAIVSFEAGDTLDEQV